MATGAMVTSSSAAAVELPPRTISIPEWGSASVELDAAMANRLRREVSTWVKVAPDWEPGRYSLSSTSFVGVLRVGDLTIRLEPKTPAPNLFEMITWAWNLPDLRRELTGLEQADDLLEFVAGAFVEKVDNLVRKGIYRAYRAEDESYPFLRGRLDVGRQLRNMWRAPGRFEQTLHEYTADVTENRILAWTLHLLGRAPWRVRNLPLRIRRAAHALPEVALAPVADSSFDRLVYTRLNESYRLPLSLARLLLRLLSLEGNLGSSPFHGWVLDMNTLFEQFVGAFLDERVRKWEPRTHIERVPRAAIEPAAGALQLERQVSILLDIQRADRGIIDLLLRRGNCALAVLDTKHKLFEGKPKDADRRQILEYANRLGIAEGMLIYSGGAPGTLERHYIGTLPLHLRTLVWPLGGTLKVFREGNERTADEILRLYAPFAQADQSAALAHSMAH